jgi:hypothetical protein
MSIEGLASSVVAHGRARVSMAGGFLNVTKRNAGVERGGDERVPQRVWPDPALPIGPVGEVAGGLSGADTRRRCRLGASQCLGASKGSRLRPHPG